MLIMKWYVAMGTFVFLILFEIFAPRFINNSTSAKTDMIADAGLIAGKLPSKRNTNE